MWTHLKTEEHTRYSREVSRISQQSHKTPTVECLLVSVYNCKFYISSSSSWNYLSVQLFTGKVVNCNGVLKTL